jgi:hypothetical protein
MILNITHNGQAKEFNLGDVQLDDNDVHRVAEELTGETYPNYVIDRYGSTIYLRPKVPFGGEF